MRAFYLPVVGGGGPVNLVSLGALRSESPSTAARMHTAILIRQRFACLRLASLLALFATSELAIAENLSVRSVDGTYELTKRVMADGTVLKPPSVSGLYTLRRGRFHLTLFFQNPDGTVASESTNGRYTFNSMRYCEWIDYTIRNNLDKPGVITEAPAVEDHCTRVTSKNGRFNFSPPGEGVATSFGPDGFTATLGNEFVDHWRKIE